MSIQYKKGVELFRGEQLHQLFTEMVLCTVAYSCTRLLAEYQHFKTL